MFDSKYSILKKVESFKVPYAKNYGFTPHVVGHIEKMYPEADLPMFAIRHGYFDEDNQWKVDYDAFYVDIFVDEETIYRATFKFHYHVFDWNMKLLEKGRA